MVAADISMTFVSKKIRVFNDRGDIKPERRRSEARLKKYVSSVDLRAWCDVVEDRRQHMLELIAKGYETCRATIIPLDVIVNTALSSKNANIQDLQKCMNKMWSFVDAASMNDQDLLKLNDLKKKMKKICLSTANDTQLSNFSDNFKTGKPIPSNYSAKTDKTVLQDDFGDSSETQQQEAGCEEPTLLKNQPIKSTRYKMKSLGPAKVRTKIIGLQEGFEVSENPNERQKKLVINAYPIKSSNTEQKLHEVSEMERDKIKNKKLGARTYSNKMDSHPNEIPDTSADLQQRQKSAQKSGESVQPNIHQKELLGIPTKPQHIKDNSTKIHSSHKNFLDSSVNQEDKTNEQKVISNKGTYQQDQSRAPKDFDKREEPLHQRSTTNEAVQSLNEGFLNHGSNDKITSLNKPISNAKANIGSQVIQLQDQLAAREALCNEQRINIENLKSERDKLKTRIEDCLKELEELKKLNNISNPVVFSSCKDEIDALEHEIKIMRSGNTSPEEEAVIIQKELEMLRKYCMKLKTLEDEHEKLKNKEFIMTNDELNGMPTVGQTTLQTAIKERDSLAEKVKQLEIQISQTPNQLDELNVYRNKVQMLDNALAERDEMRKQLEKMKDLEKENLQLRKTVEKGEDLTQTQKTLAKNDLTDLEFRKTQSRCTCLEKEIQNLRKEREVMSKRIELMKSEIEILRPKAKEGEMLKLERDKLQIKLNELSHVQIHNENLMLKCKCLENALTERDTYKQKYEDILSMECQCDLLRNQAEENMCLIREKDLLQKQIEDLKTCIHEQEDEINRLMSNIDDLVRNKDDAQTRMKDALANMRSEVEKKDSIIALSEEKLAAVQMQLKSSIQGVSCETICYKTRIEELERELSQSQRMIKSLQKQLKDKAITKDQMDVFDNMRKELEEARQENKKLQEIAQKMALLTGDEHVQQMLRQSECAVKKVVEELGKQYQEWDLMRNRQNYTHISKEHVYATRKDLSDEIEMKSELEDIKKEKEKLERIVAEIQNEKYARSCQKMMDILKTENARLKEQLQKEIGLRKRLEQRK